MRAKAGGWRWLASGWREATFLQGTSRVLVALMVVRLLFNVGRGFSAQRFDGPFYWSTGILGAVAVALTLMTRESQETPKP